MWWIPIIIGVIAGITLIVIGCLVTSAAANRRDWKDNLMEAYVEGGDVKWTRNANAVEKHITAARDIPVSDGGSGARERRNMKETCYHKWREVIDSQFSNERVVEVVCIICGIHGEKNIEDGKVFWPAT